jgi:tungstate transport system ATP-binding protein
MIRIESVSKQYGNADILTSINLEIRKGEIFTLIGPSGSGKTTLLRLIDLLDTPTSGKIFFDGQDTAQPETGRLLIRRRMAMVFQKPAVLNTTVAQNIEFGLRFRGVPQRETDRNVQAALELVGLPDFAGRRAVTLSGGEMQRVAIARAMITEPDVLLMDEPTANLDPVSSDLIENLIRGINRKFGVTVIMATHDMIQGQRLADRIGVIMDGKLVQTGGTDEIFYQPAGREIARFVGIDAITGAVVKENRGGHALIKVQDICFEVLTNLKEGQRAALYIRPEEVTLSPAADSQGKTSVRNQLKGRITKMVPSGPFIRIIMDCGIPLTAVITRRSCTELGLTVGSAVVAGVKATAIHVLADDGIKSIQ